MFPPGLPGIGLLFLRASVAIALLVECFYHATSVWTQGSALLLSISLLAGFLTPIAATIGLLLHALCWSTLGLDSTAVAAMVSLDMFALAFLGPGAYSVDASRFGRRQLVLPPKG